jgi:hypothetical protein
MNNNFIEQLKKETILNKLTKEFQVIFLNKIENLFVTENDRKFVLDFICYLKYHPREDLVVNFDVVWKRIGFQNKQKATNLLKTFVCDTDYKVKITKQTQKYFLSIQTFKKFCLKSNYDKLHDDFIKLELLLKETIDEEQTYVRIQLEKKEQEINNKERKLRRVVQRRNFKKGHAIYVGKNPSDMNNFKVGITKDLNSRISQLNNSNSIDYIMQPPWYTRFNRQIEEAVKINFSDYRFLERKEFYLDEHYDEIVEYIQKLYEFFQSTDRNPQFIEEPKEKERKNHQLANEKPCNNCKIVQPLENFNKALEHRDGRENRCKNCVNLLQKQYIENKRANEEIPKEKPCSQCQKILPLEDFFVDRQKFDGRGTKCKSCFISVQKQEKKQKKIDEYTCPKCKITKKINEFGKSSRNQTGYSYQCKQCVRKIQTEYYHKNKKEESKEDDNFEENEDSFEIENDCDKKEENLMTEDEYEHDFDIEDEELNCVLQQKTINNDYEESKEQETIDKSYNSIKNEEIKFTKEDIEIEPITGKFKAPPKEFLIQELKKGISIEKIGRHLGVSSKPVVKWLQDQNINHHEFKTKSNKYVVCEIPPRHELLKLLETKNQTEISQYYDISMFVLRKWLKTYNIDVSESKLDKKIDKETIVRLINENKTEQQILEELNITELQYKKLLKIHNIEKIPSKEELEQILQEKSKDDVANHYNTTRNTLRKWITLHKLNDIHFTKNTHRPIKVIKENGEEIIFDSVKEMCKELHISHVTFKEYVDKNVFYRGYKFENIEN